MRLTGPKLGLNLRTKGAAYVTLYRTWRPSDLFTGTHGQVIVEIIATTITLLAYV